jgi:hypothetical protein
MITDMNEENQKLQAFVKVMRKIVLEVSRDRDLGDWVS